ncbi:hypothetical protein ABZZ20_30760 [Streptomyces sp. NPDC006430]|uniref:hypothetical protein n=1 Tax=Streptomyces sp. NPDC006430 TaxID=3154299 RepID=UPI00339EC56C
MALGAGPLAVPQLQLRDRRAGGVGGEEAPIAVAVAWSSTWPVEDVRASWRLVPFELIFCVSYDEAWLRGAFASGPRMTGAPLTDPGAERQSRPRPLHHAAC